MSKLSFKANKKNRLLFGACISCAIPLGALATFLEKKSAGAILWRVETISSLFVFEQVIEIN